MKLSTSHEKIYTPPAPFISNVVVPKKNKEYYFGFGRAFNYIHTITNAMFNREEILTADDESAAHELASYAMEFAVLGYLNDARDLVTLLNNYSFYHAATSVLRSLWLAWAETDSWPEKEEGRVDMGIEELRKRSYEAHVNRAFDYYKNEERPIQDDAAGVVKLLTCADGDDDATTGWRAMIKSAALSAALELRLKLAEEGNEDEEEEEADGHGDLPSVEDILARIAERLYSMSQIEYLAQMARAWEILKYGVLARALRIKDVKVKKLAREVRGAFTRRFTHGRKIEVLEPMKDLVKVLEENTQRTIKSEGARAELGLDVGLRAEKALEIIQEPGLTATEIAELEKRLDVQLPTDYKEFLSTSNGLGMTWSEILMAPPLHAAEQVRWNVETDAVTDLGVYFLPESILYPCRSNPALAGLVQYNKWPKVGRAIQIGSEDIASVWLLTPVTVAKVRDAYLKIIDWSDTPQELKDTMLNAVRSFAGSREQFEGLDWCVMYWRAGGAASKFTYPSFGEYIAENARRSATEFCGTEERRKRRCFAYDCR